MHANCKPTTNSDKLSELFICNYNLTRAVAWSEHYMDSTTQIRVIWRSFHRWRRGIGPRLLVRILLFSAAITLILTSFQLYVDYRYAVGAIESRMSEIEGSYLQSLSEGLWNQDSRQIELQIEGILRLPAMRFVEVRETTDRVNPI